MRKLFFFFPSQLSEKLWKMEFFSSDWSNIQCGSKYNLFNSCVNRIIYIFIENYVECVSRVAGEDRANPRVEIIVEELQ